MLGFCIVRLEIFNIEHCPTVASAILHCLFILSFRIFPFGEEKFGINLVFEIKMESRNNKT